MGDSEAELPADTTVGRVTLHVNSLDRLVEFYCDIVGLSVLERTPQRATLGAGETALFEFRHAPEARPRDPDEAGLFHAAVRVPDRAALGAALERIDSEWRLSGASDHRVSEALYLRDPEDNGIEIYRDRAREAWPTAEGRVRMDTLPLDLDALRDDASSARRVPEATDMGHVHLEVTDLEAARTFYAETVGLDLRQEHDGAAFLAAGGYHHHVGLNVWNGRSVPAAGRGLGLERFELLVPGGDLAGIRQRLETAGLAVSDTDGGFSADDPDGIGVSFTASAP